MCAADIYHYKKEEIQHHFGAQQTQLAAAAPAPGADSAVRWEYKWQKDSEDVQGPFTTAEMLDWRQQVTDLSLLVTADLFLPKLKKYSPVSVTIFIWKRCVFSLHTTSGANFFF